MTTLSRVVWNEGMHLAQHHFQVQNRYFEDSIAFAVSNLYYRSYGVAGYELDADALRNGTVSVIHARGVMPDGLAFHCPDGDAIPPSREIRDLFSPTQDSHLVLLAIPAYQRGHSNCVLESDGDSNEARYLAETTTIFDETTGQDEKPVTLGRKNFRLYLDIEAPENVVSLPIARIRRDGAGQFIYDPDYIPPCLQIGASGRIMEMLSRLIEILDSKADAMAQERRSAHKSLAEYAANEVASFWLSHTVHASLSPLRYHQTVKHSHPEQLYTEMVRLAGALCTFSLQAHPRDLPNYDHDHLDECLNALDRHIRANLDIIIPTSSVTIPLAKKADYLYGAQVADRRALGPSQWILGIRSSAGDAQVIAGVPKLVKVCSAAYILRLVREGLPGLTLQHLPTPPAAISPRVGTHYFNIQLAGPAWQAIIKAADVGVYVPNAIPNAEVELMVIVDTPT